MSSLIIQTLFIGFVRGSSFSPIRVPSQKGCSIEILTSLVVSPEVQDHIGDSITPYPCSTFYSRDDGVTTSQHLAPHLPHRAEQKVATHTQSVTECEYQLGGIWWNDNRLDRPDTEVACAKLAVIKAQVEAVISTLLSRERLREERIRKTREYLQSQKVIQVDESVKTKFSGKGVKVSTKGYACILRFPMSTGDTKAVKQDAVKHALRGEIPPAKIKALGDSITRSIGGACLLAPSEVGTPNPVTGEFTGKVNLSGPFRTRTLTCTEACANIATFQFPRGSFGNQPDDSLLWKRMCENMKELRGLVINWLTDPMSD